MKNIFILLSVWYIFISSSYQYSLNDDEKLIDGYGPDFIDHQLDPEEAEFERQQENRLPFEEVQRFRRGLKYRVMESPGLHSHFQVVQDDEILRTNPQRRRNRRSTDSKSELHSDEVEDIETQPRRAANPDDVSVEGPVAEKRTMTPAYYRADDARTMDKWVKDPYYQSRIAKEEEDTQGDASSSVGIKSRTPRVNFITQQSSSQGSNNNKDEPDGPEARERERERERERDRDRDRDQQANKQPEEGYRKPASNDRDRDRERERERERERDRYSPSYYGNKNYDTYPQAPNYVPNYDRYNDRPYYNRDRYNERTPAYYPYNERDLAYNDRPPPGMSRMTPPMGPSSSLYYRHQYNEYDDYVPRSVPNYYYSDKRFDMPMEPRDPYERDLYRPYLYSNEVNNRPGRIIYYANLPEIVRPVNNYPSANARYADPYRGQDDYRNFRTAKSVNYPDAPPATTTMRISSAPARVDTARSRSYYK